MTEDAQAGRAAGKKQRQHSANTGIENAGFMKKSMSRSLDDWFLDGLSLFILWIVALEFYQGGQSDGYQVYLGFLLLIFAMAVLRYAVFPALRHVPLVLLVGGSVFFWFAYVTPHRVLQDLSAIAVALLLTILLTPRVRFAFANRCIQFWSHLWKKRNLLRPAPFRHDQRMIWSDTRTSLTLIILSWLLISLFDLVRVSESPLPLDPSRFLTTSKPEWSERKIGVALSGGGYRAIVYHAGVLTALEQMGVRITHLSTVSSGSIIGAYYAFGGAPERFLQSRLAQQLSTHREKVNAYHLAQMACQARIPFTDYRVFPFCNLDRYDVRTRNLREIFFSNLTLSQEGDGPLPRLMINIADVRHKQLLGFTRNQLIRTGSLYETNRVYKNGLQVQLDSLPDLASMVSISNAFPTQSRPYDITLSLSEQDSDSVQWNAYEIRGVDGSIMDHTAYKTLHIAANSSSPGNLPVSDLVVDEEHVAEWRLDMALLSDATTFHSLNETGYEERRALDLAISQINSSIAERYTSYSVNRLSPFRYDGFRGVRASQNLFPPKLDQYDDETIYQLTQLVPSEDLLHLPQAHYYETTQAWVMNENSFIANEIPAWDQDFQRLEAWLRAGHCSEKQFTTLFPHLNGGCEYIKLAFAINKDFRRCLRIFKHTSPLKEVLGHGEIAAIYRLGQYSVLFEAPWIRRVLNGNEMLVENRMSVN